MLRPDGSAGYGSGGYDYSGYGYGYGWPYSYGDPYGGYSDSYTFLRNAEDESDRDQRGTQHRWRRTRQRRRSSGGDRERRLKCRLVRSAERGRCQLAEIIREHRRRLIGMQHPGLASNLVFPSNVGRYQQPSALREPLLSVLAKKELPRITVHGLRRTFNNLVRQQASGIVTRAIMGHVSEIMTNHLGGGHGRDEKGGGRGRETSPLDGKWSVEPCVARDGSEKLSESR